MDDRVKVARAIELLKAGLEHPPTMFYARPFELADATETLIAALPAMQGDGWRGIEPVAWRYTYPDGADRLLPYRSDRYTAARGWTETPLYALPAPPSAPDDEGLTSDGTDLAQIQNKIEEVAPPALYQQQPIFLPSAVYDEAVDAGHDMQNYRKVAILPVSDEGESA